MDQVDIPIRTQELIAKFQNAMQKNPDWFLEAKQMVEETGQPIPYDERIGMTESEYNEFLAIMQNKNDLIMMKSGTESITINHSENQITFINDGRLEILNRLVIDLTDSSVTLGSHKLIPLKRIEVPDDNNGLKSSWSGYEWRYEESNKETEELQTMEAYSDLSMTICKVIIAQLHKTQKTYMHIQYTQFENGKEIINYQMPLIFQ